MTDAMVTMRVPFVDLGAQHEELDGLDGAIRGVVDRSAFILGDEVAEFENEFAAYCESTEAVGVDSGLSALELALRSIGVGSGDEVITVANTFVASALAISHSGATPVLVDMDPNTYQLDPAQLDAAITDKTAAIMPVHLYGQPAEMESITSVARAHGLAVVEDASQAHGAIYRGRRVGSLSDAAGFSLYPAKNLGALGDAGILVTSDDAVAAGARLLRNYGSRVKYEHQVEGFNRRLDTIHAAVLRLKLPILDEWNERRRGIAATYRAMLAEVDAIALPPIVPDTEPVFHLFVVRVRDRDGLQAHLSDRGISTVIHYPTPIHLLGAYRHLGHRPGAFPETETHAAECLSLPIFPHMKAEQVEYVVDGVRTFFRGR